MACFSKVVERESDLGRVDPRFLDVHFTAKEMDTEAFKDSKLVRIKIHHGLTTIAKRSFRCCQQLSSIMIPDTVTDIEEGAFESCASLKSLDLPSTIKRIDMYAFCGAGLESISLPSVTRISQFCFKGTKVVSIQIPDGVTHIDNGAFQNCAKLEFVRLPSTLQYIGDDAFQNCHALESVTFNGSPPPIKIGGTCFEGCENLVSIDFVVDGATIGAAAFRGCRRLLEVSIPSHVIVKERAFENCSGLVLATIHATLQQNGKAFQSCSNLRFAIAPILEKGNFGGIRLNNACSVKTKKNVRPGLTLQVASPKAEREANHLRAFLRRKLSFWKAREHRRAADVCTFRQTQYLLLVLMVFRKFSVPNELAYIILEFLHLSDLPT